MARVSKGNQLNELKLQPGWTIEEDGFGLLTSRLIFVTNQSTDEGQGGITLLDKIPAKGDVHPKDSRLRCHRASTTIGANGLATVTAEYIGISKGNMTQCEVSGRGNMSTEPITTHPKFVEKIGGTAASTKNGAQFNTAGLFIGFIYDQNAASLGLNKEGVRSYLNPGFGISGHFYTSDIGIARKLKDDVGKTSGSGKFSGVQLLGGLGSLNSQTSDSWYGEWTTDDYELNQLMLTGVAIEFFGNLVKVSYDITYAKYGWDSDIYDASIGSY